MTLGKDEIENIGRYHPPKPEQIDKYENVRSFLRVWLEAIDKYVPEGPEKQLAVERARESVMWANAGIACRS